MMNISSAVKPQSDFEKFLNNFIDFMPKCENIQNIDGRIGIEQVIPIDTHDIYMYQFNKTYIEEYIDRTWKYMHHEIVSHITKIMMRRNNYYHIIKLISSVHEWNNPLSMLTEIKLRLVADITVAETSNIVIPKFIYSSNNEIIEWRCGACATPNGITSRWCSQCGSPRALLLQEMMCIRCGTPKNDGLCCSQCGGNYGN